MLWDKPPEGPIPIYKPKTGGAVMRMVTPMADSTITPIPTVPLKPRGHRD